MKKLLAICFLIILFVAFIFLKNSLKAVVDSSDVSSDELVFDDILSYFPEDILNSSYQVEEHADSFDIKKAVEKRKEEFDQLRKIGYPSADESRVYRGYSIESLEELLFAGDVYAYMPLVEKYIQEKDHARIVLASKIAAVYGSTPAMLMSAGREVTLAEFATQEGEEKAFQDHVVTSRALFRLASLLGDPYAEEQLADDFSRLGIELDEELIIRSELRADHFRNHLNELRRRQGLDEL